MDDYKKIRELLISTICINIVGNAFLSIRYSGILIYVNLILVIYLIHIENKKNMKLSILLTTCGLLLSVISILILVTK